MNLFQSIQDFFNLFWFGCLFVSLLSHFWFFHFYHLHVLYQSYLGLCQAACVQSHQRQPMSAVAIATCEVQVSTADSQTVPTTGPTHAKLVSLTSPCCSGWPCPMNTLKANNGPLDPGVGDERFFRFKRNDGISKYTLNGIFSMILNFNRPTIVMKPKNLLLRFISI